MCDAQFEFKAEPLMVSGIWKFSSAITLAELTELAIRWKTEHPEEYQDLFIRGVGKNDALGIGFRYKIPEGLGVPAEVSQRQFFHGMTDKLKRRFGNDFAGYDTSHPTYMIKPI